VWSVARVKNTELEDLLHALDVAQPLEDVLHLAPKQLGDFCRALLFSEPVQVAYCGTLEIGLELDAVPAWTAL
jgi:hypothetical protein